MVNATSNSRILTLPTRVNNATVEQLQQALGIKRVCEQHPHAQFNPFCQYEMPEAGWQIVDSDVSPYQKRLVRPDGVQVAKLFYKESFHSGSIELIDSIAKAA
ncbi:MAG TPA: hypothetical protein V6C81_12660 [Planktothrix sp.]|jgi:hypothetical protein